MQPPNTYITAAGKQKEQALKGVVIFYLVSLNVQYKVEFKLIKTSCFCKFPQESELPVDIS